MRLSPLCFSVYLVLTYTFHAVLNEQLRDCQSCLLWAFIAIIYSAPLYNRT